MNKKTDVLVVFANPRGTEQLRLSNEDRAIHEAIKLSKFRDNINIKTCHAATVHDLRRSLLENDYQIVQISGHGTGKGLILEDDVGGVYLVPQDGLFELFQAYASPKGLLECVLLNACYSLTQGKLVSLGVPFTIAMEGSISDRAAIEFSRGFYDAVGAGRSIEFAYDEGCRTVKLAAPGTKFESKLLKKDEVYVIENINKDSAHSEKQFKFREVSSLVGLAIDLSGSMTSSIRNNTGGKLSRLESFRESLDRFVKEAKNSIQVSKSKNIETSIDLFAYGFGLRGDIGVCDLLSLIKVGKDIISKEEIEELKDRYTSEMKNQYSSYSGLGNLARQWGLGGLVSEAEDMIRSSAESEIRRKIMYEVKSRLENKLNKIGDTTLSIEEVARLWESSGETLGNADELIYGNTPMKQALARIKERFKKEMKKKPKDTIPILFVLSDGEPTDGNPTAIMNELKRFGVTVISCYVTSKDLANPRILYGIADPNWEDGAKLMFDISSTIEDDSNFANFLLKKGWRINPESKLFVQVNHSEILEEFIRVILSPLEERASIQTLPMGI